MKFVKLLALALCASLAMVPVCSADENVEELLQPQVYDLGETPKPPPVKIKKQTPPPKPAPKQEVDKFVVAPPPPPPPPRYEAPPPRPTPPPPVMGDDSHFIQGDDYFIQRHGLEGHTWIYVELAKMVNSPGSNTKGEAEFMKVRDGKNYWTSHYWQTRIAFQSELRLGLNVIIFEGNHRNSIYDAPERKDRARGSSWFMARITDMSDMYKGYVTVSGNYKVSLRNMRVIVH